MCGRNELKVCTMVSFSHISVYSVLCQCIHTNTRILKSFEDREPTGLKVDIAESSTSKGRECGRGRKLRCSSGCGGGRGRGKRAQCIPLKNKYVSVIVVCF